MSARARRTRAPAGKDNTSPAGAVSGGRAGITPGGLKPRSDSGFAAGARITHHNSRDIGSVIEPLPHSSLRLTDHWPQATVKLLRRCGGGKGYPRQAKTRFTRSHRIFSYAFRQCSTSVHCAPKRCLRTNSQSCCLVWSRTKCPCRTSHVGRASLATSASSRGEGRHLPR